MAGIEDAFRTSIYTTTSTFGGTLVGMFLIYRVFGRRSMMLIGTTLSVLFFLGVAIPYTVAPGTPAAGSAIIAFCILYAICYNCFSGTMSWPLANEVVSSRLRVVTFSLATGVNYFFSCKSTLVAKPGHFWLTRLVGLISYCSPFLSIQRPSTGVGSTAIFGRDRI